jgi:hypothetical protein
VNLAVALADGHLPGLVNRHQAERFSPQVVRAGIADGADDVLLDAVHLRLLPQPSEHAQQRILHYVLGILSDADAHVGKAEQPVLSLRDNPFQFCEYLFRFLVHPLFAIRFYYYKRKNTEKDLPSATFFQKSRKFYESFIDLAVVGKDIDYNLLLTIQCRD